MGLAEKRALKAFQTENFPSCKAAVEELVGHEIPMSVDWDALNETVSADKAGEFWDNTFFLPLVTALEEICADEFGKEAVGEQLKSVKVKGANRHVFTVTWSGGQLCMDIQVRDDMAVGGPGTKTYKDRVDAIRTVLEEHLG